MSEKKYLITSTTEQSAKELFRQIVHEMPTVKIGEYLVCSFQSTEETYRYFDTLDMRLTSNGVEVFIGPALLSQSSGIEYVLNIKFQKEDEVCTFPFPKGVSIDEIDLNGLWFWQPLKKARVYSSKQLLTEVARLNLKTHRFNMERQKEQKVQIVLSAVEALTPFQKNDLYQLDIGRLAQGVQADVEYIYSYFRKHYSDTIQYAPYDTWTKAKRLFRGEELIQPSSDEEEDSGEEKE